MNRNFAKTAPKMARIFDARERRAERRRNAANAQLAACEASQSTAARQERAAQQRKLAAEAAQSTDPGSEQVRIWHQAVKVTMLAVQEASEQAVADCDHAAQQAAQARREHERRVKQNAMLDTRIARGREADRAMAEETEAEENMAGFGKEFGAFSFGGDMR